MNERDHLPLTDDEIRSIAEDFADASAFVSLADDARIVRSADGLTAQVAAWVMVRCGQMEDAALVRAGAGGRSS